MLSDVQATLLKLLRNGVDVDLACETAIAPLLLGGHGGGGPSVRWVAPSTPIATIPDPRCIAGKLRDIAEPTAEDIAAAFKSCAPS